MYLHSHLIPIVFLVDILVQANTWTFVRGCLIKDHLIIIKQYISRRLFPDVITLIVVYDETIIGEITPLIFFLRLFYFSNALERIRELVMLNEVMNGIFSLGVLFAKIIFVAHIFSCIWHYIGYKQLVESQAGWLVFNQLVGSNLEIKYLNALYYIVVTM